MKIFLKLSLVLLMLVVLVIVSATLFYEYNESESYKVLRVNCEMIELSGILNNYYREHGEYPMNLLAVQKSATESIRCGRVVTIEGESISDPWGDSYVYDRRGPSNVGMYSDNLADEQFDLVSGSMGRN
ncbi:hypothetical protein BTA51_26550 [Hahella sp. CCB-MM4]|nr:hypothetical protein BTA51_26550 [Hahella sp. CCB-MM4]